MGTGGIEDFHVSIRLGGGEAKGKKKKKTSRKKGRKKKLKRELCSKSPKSV